MIEPHSTKGELSPLRQQDLTMSLVGAVAGLSPYTTPFDIWAQKMGLASPPEMTPAMQLGVWCEPAVARAHQDLYPDIDITYPLDLYLRDPELRLGGTPDATGFDRDRPD